jgi:hypothetical protein
MGNSFEQRKAAHRKMDCLKAKELKHRIVGTENLIILLFSFAVFLYCYFVSNYSSGILQSHHGLYHAAYIYQLYNGIFPPTNPQAAGAPGNVYWPWHLSISLLMRILRMSPLQVVAVVNSLSLAVAVIFLYKLARKVFSWSVSSSLVVAVLPFVLLEFGCAFYFLLRKMSFGHLPDYVRLWDLTAGIEANLRSVWFVRKFFNQSSFPTVTGLYCMLFYLDNKKAPDGSQKCLWLQLLGYVLLGLYNPIALFAFDLWALSRAISAFRPKDFLSSLGDAAKVYLALIVANGLILPYVYLLSAHIGGQTALKASLGRSLKHHGNMWVFLLLLAILVVHRRTRSVHPNPHFKQYFTFMAVSLLATNLIALPAGNEYKIVLLSCIPLAFLLWPTVRDFLAGRSAPMRQLKVVTAAVVFLLLTFAAYEKITSDMGKQNPWLFRGTQTRLNLEATDADLLRVSSALAAARVPDLQDMCDWIMDNTEKTAFILRKPVGGDSLVMNGCSTESNQKANSMPRHAGWNAQLSPGLSVTRTNCMLSWKDQPVYAVHRAEPLSTKIILFRCTS